MKKNYPPRRKSKMRYSRTRQLTPTDARAFLAKQPAPANLTEEETLRWLAKEYGVDYTALDELEPDKQVLALFPARLAALGGASGSLPQKLNRDDSGAVSLTPPA